MTNHVIEPDLLDILELQLLELCVTGAEHIQSEEYSVPILPILIVLNKLPAATNPVVFYTRSSLNYFHRRERRIF